MNQLSQLWNEIIFRPIVNLLVIVYSNLPFLKLGLAIIIITIVFRLITYPLSISATKQQKEMKKLEPEINKLKTKYKDNKQKIKKKWGFALKEFRYENNSI